MPFDSRPEGVEVPVPAAVQAIDKVIELLGPEGECWAQGTYNEGRRYCVVGAMHATDTMRLALPLVNRALGCGGAFSDAPVVGFNDARCRTFADIKAVLLKARGLAWEESYAV